MRRRGAGFCKGCGTGTYGRLSVTWMPKTRRTRCFHECCWACYGLLRGVVPCFCDLTEELQVMFHLRGGRG